MDKATILAAIEEANQEHSRNFKALQKIGSKIAEKSNELKSINKRIEILKEVKVKSYNDQDFLKDELTKLKVREGEILATKAAFEKMLDGTK